MANLEGSFVWYELMTPDPKAAEVFYGKVAGWGLVDAGHPAMRYTLACLGEHRLAGIMAMPEAMQAEGCRPGWIGYVAVADVDAKAAEAERLGGQVVRAPDDIPEIGRFAVIADPQGAKLVLFRGNGAPPPRPAPGTPGLFGWHELYATDWPAAFAFYEALFGWTKGQAIAIGPMGIYQLFHAPDAPAEGMATGGMMSLSSPPAPFWLYYIVAGEIEAAAGRIRAHGGAILNGPMEVPGGMWIVQAADPQGANFAVVGPRAGA
ncbi:VOC family protein [Methylobacterium organophilum]|uniref:VOC family protein n=1 Tax=Methylobacterium organophilum TaxID=410 RepID=UPI001F13B345|nr:VOC family protein [Methylobacterium organophilum]UMY16168.1 VOC family protein [Methylobacterium organophilum]